jgi:acetylornithine deacetylase/succinyl-diaminopimelate desuccinylase-like protein
LLQRLIRFDTVNPPGNEADAQDHLMGLLEGAGWECEQLERSPAAPIWSRACAAPRRARPWG